VKDACRAPYITALVTEVLDLETTMLHVLDPTVGCICTAIMVASPLFPIYYYRNAIHHPGCRIVILHPMYFHFLILITLCLHNQVHIDSQQKFDTKHCV
jgi:hypothetical protein